jgi:hypothetical protein
LLANKLTQLMYQKKINTIMKTMKNIFTKICFYYENHISQD